MANIDKLIINDPSASEPTNSLEMYVAKINGTYTGDIPEPTNDLEKALAQVAAKPSPAPGGSGWAKAKIYNEYYDILVIYYVGPDGWHVEMIPKDADNPTEITAVSTLTEEGNVTAKAYIKVITRLSKNPGTDYVPSMMSANLYFDDDDYTVANPLVLKDTYYSEFGTFEFYAEINCPIDLDIDDYDPETSYYKIQFFKSNK